MEPIISPKQLKPVNLLPAEDGFVGLKVGSARAKLQDNTPDDITEANIKSCLERKRPSFRPSLVKHDGHMVIVGSGPSVANHVEEIRAEKKIGRPIMAIKGAHDWLCERSIRPDLWVSMDSQDKIVEGIKHRALETCYLVSSKCSPKVFDWLENMQVVVWHAWFGKGEERFFPEGEVLVGGGSTSGLRGITLAWLMGFSKVILYGFDSCLSGKTKRVDGSETSEWIIHMQAGLNGPDRYCDGSMASQATEFQAMTMDVMRGLKIKVVGDGLIADIMEERKRLGLNDWT